MQSRSSTNIFGIDVSHHQGTIDWKKVKAKYAIVKATEGRTYSDPQFRRNAVGAPAVGIPVGFYHYAHPQRNSAAQEAENFLEAIKGLKATLPHVLDIEEPDSKALGRDKLTAWCAEWCAIVEKQTGHKVMIYTGADYAKNYLGAALSKYPLWVAHYGVSTPMKNSTWDKWAIFQYADRDPKNESGLGLGNVDLNVMEASFMEEILGKAKPVVTKGPDYKGRWSTPAIEAVLKTGHMSVDENGNFRPTDPVTREELAAVIQRMLNK